MGTHFVGSEDVALCTAQAVTQSAPWTGAWFEPSEAEIYELAYTLASLETDKVVNVIVEGDLGIVGGTQQVSVLGSVQLAANGSGTLDINLGSLPGSRRIRCRATSDGDVTGGTLTAALREGRSGLLNQ